MNQLQQIYNLAHLHPDNRVLFDDPIKVKPTPHQHVFTVYGVWSGEDGVYVRDGAGDWHGPLLPEQGNGELMINSIYQRLKMMPAPVSVVVAEYDESVNATIFD